MSYFKNNPARDEAYLEWIRGQPSVVSGGGLCEAHHIEGHGMGGTSKQSDYFTIPLRHHEHREFHQMGWQTWEATYGINQLEACARLMERYLARGK